ncbi:hypothetical protein [Parasphingorhabdus sp.]|jgi:hypothetical protein|uniref:hypothetical protein n=1 Tax=Parasphingorhabdus sp. TaxID=2709688 RepID=UPI003BAEB1B4
MTEHLLNDRVKHARQLLDRQRKRSLFFSSNNIFGDPAWELLLEVYIASDQHHCVLKTDLYAKLSVSESIASRWLTVFLDRGDIEICESHGYDHLRMTDRALSECEAYLDSMTD